MRYRLLPIFLMLSLSACSFQVDVLTPQSVALETQTQTPPPFPANTSTIQPGLFLPTDTPPSLPIFTPLPPPENSGIYPIRFAANGTYLDIEDGITAGSSKVYSVNALKGQVMSVSIRQSENGNWGTIPMKIIGEDGAILCPLQENRECYFWRGILPVSQDYFITLKPELDVLHFTMRVAVDPPGAINQTFRYLSNDRNVSFSYSDEFAPARFPEGYIYKFKPEFALQFIDSGFYDGTNLDEAYFLFGSSNDKMDVGNCFQPSAGIENEQTVGDVEINGTWFVRSERGGIAAGNIYEQIMYRTVLRSTCYQITFFIHYADVGAYSPELKVREFDRAGLKQKFEEILSSLVMN